MTTEKSPIEVATEQARDMNLTARQTAFSGLTNEAFTPIDQSYPETLTDNATPPTRRENRIRHQEYIDRVSKQMLTASLFLGLGIEPPAGHALNKDKSAEIATSLDATFTKVKDDEYGEVVVTTVDLGDAQYTFRDTDLWLAYIRAIHFALTRNDPDLTEFINRQLANKAGLADAAWLDAAHAAPSEEVEEA